MQQIKICTSFDITQTNVRRVYKQQGLPVTIQGRNINSINEWNFLRKQQSNWETVLQVLLFRTQPLNLSLPILSDNKWCFTFVNEHKGIFNTVSDSFGILRQDFEGTPIITGLNEKENVLPYIHTLGKNQNIWITEV
jgi:hypothetical protein